MDSRNETSLNFNPEEQLEYLRLRCHNVAPKIYHDQDSYLAALRNLLLNAAKQAVFILSTEREENHLNRLTPEQRIAFHQVIEDLVRNCSSLLTIEQIRDLVAVMEREKKLKKAQAKQQFLNSLAHSATDMRKDYSVTLGLDPPLENTSYLENLFAIDDEQNQESVCLDGIGTPKEGINDDFTEEINQISADKRSLHSSGSSLEGKNSELEILQTLFVMAGDVMESETSVKSKSSDSTFNDENFLSGVLDPERGFLPDNSLALASWVELFELALSRRLRNLSHAINVELLRAGLINSLLPLGVLDAVIKGQIESMSVNSNILSLRIPIPTHVGHSGMDVSCILIRTSDLEFENPTLRLYRKKIKDHRNLLLKMVKQHRHWQNRSIAKEAQEQWSNASANPKSL